MTADVPAQFPHLEGAAVEVEQEVDADLAGAVVGDLAAAVDLHQRDTDIPQQVLRLSGLAQGEYRGVFDDPQFIGGFRCACGREFLHCGESWRVLHAPEPPHPQAGRLRRAEGLGGWHAHLRARP